MTVIFYTITAFLDCVDSINGFTILFSNFLLLLLNMLVIFFSIKYLLQNLKISGYFKSLLISLSHVIVTYIVLGLYFGFSFCDLLLFSSFHFKKEEAFHFTGEEGWGALVVLGISVIILIFVIIMNFIIYLIKKPSLK